MTKAIIIATMKGMLMKPMPMRRAVTPIKEAM